MEKKDAEYGEKQKDFEPECSKMVEKRVYHKPCVSNEESFAAFSLKCTFGPSCSTQGANLSK